MKCSQKNLDNNCFGFIASRLLENCVTGQATTPRHGEF